MTVRPIELANVCAVFVCLRTAEVAAVELRHHVQDSMLMSSYSDADDIIGEAVKAGLLALRAGGYRPTNIGWQLAKMHDRPRLGMGHSARKCFLKNVFLNPHADVWCCGHFLLRFRVDPILETFAYDRTGTETGQETSWLMRLSDVGLIRVDGDRAMILPEYLGIVNEFLDRIRNPSASPRVDSDVDRNEIGELAERFALVYERNRLDCNALSYLAPLVAQVSKVDRSAGYDILSFRGTRTDPETNIFIEVKGTRSSDIRFIWSPNERRVAEQATERYWIYVYTNVDLEEQRADGPVTIQNPFNSLAELGYSVTPLDVWVTKQPPST